MLNILAKPSKIIVRTPNWLGDLMMSTAFVGAVLKCFPDSVVDLVVRSGFQNLPLPHRGRLIPFDKNKDSLFRFGKTLADGKYDRIYILPPSFSSALMAFLSGIPQRIGYKGECRSFLLRPGVSYSRPPRSRHLVNEYLDLLGKDLSVEDFKPKLTVDSEWIENVLQGKFKALPEDFVVMAPGALYGPAKQWPLTHFRSLISLLHRSKRQTVIVGIESDRESGEYLSDVVPGTVNLCGRTSLVELIAIMAKAKMLISNDSGTMHAAAALRKPQVAIFGSTSTVWTPPLNTKAEILTLKLNCAPCYKRNCPLGSRQCLNDISPEMAMEKINELYKKYNL